MDWLIEVLIGSSFAHMMAVLAFVIAAGMWLGRFKICGVSLGATFVLLVGIAVSHFGMKFQDKLYEEFKVEIEKGGFISAHWDGTPETEELIKQETKATIRCIPLDGDTTPGVCMVTGKPSARRVLFARAY